MNRTLMQLDEMIVFTIPEGQKITFDPTYHRLVGRDIVQKLDGSAYNEQCPVMRKAYDEAVGEAIESELARIEGDNE